MPKTKKITERVVIETKRLKITIEVYKKKKKSKIEKWIKRLETILKWFGL